MPSRESAIEQLAKRLLAEMEHLDPTAEGPHWHAIPDRYRTYCELCVEALLEDRNLVMRALGEVRASDDHMVCGHTNI
jgi:hypothetical protein